MHFLLPAPGPPRTRRVAARTPRVAARATRALILALVLACASGTPALAAPGPAVNLHQAMSAGLATPDGLPGQPTAAPSAQALSSSLAQATGEAPAEVTTQDSCPAAAPGQVACDAQVLVLRANRRLVRPRLTHDRAAKVQTAADDVTPASSPATSPPSPDTPAYLQQAYDLTLPVPDRRGGRHGGDRRRVRRPDRRVGPRHVPRDVRAAGVHDRQRLLREGQRERASLAAARGNTRLGGRGVRSTSTPSPRCARTATSCSSRRSTSQLDRPRPAVQTRGHASAPSRSPTAGRRSRAPSSRARAPSPARRRRRDRRLRLHRHRLRRIPGRLPGVTAAGGTSLAAASSGPSAPRASPSRPGR